MPKTDAISPSIRPLRHPCATVYSQVLVPQHFVLSLKMKPQTNGSRVHKPTHTRVEGPTWLIIAAGAFLTTLSISLAYKLKHAINSRSTTHNATTILKGTRGSMEVKCPQNEQMLSEFNGALPLVTVPPVEFSKENGVVWACSPDRLKLSSKPFHLSNCSDSPCVSESGSDVFSKREVIQKPRQQLKRRDDMILEIQGQMAELQNSLNAQLGLSSHLQLQVEAANKDLFDSEREIQQLRKAIADHCVGYVLHDKSPTGTTWSAETRNGHLDGDIHFTSPVLCAGHHYTG
ncbi:hypothetical protein RYX36_027667 [Vicia faba]